MAYGSWSNYNWKRVYSGAGYNIDVQWRYKQDPVANKTTYSACQVKITGVHNHYTQSRGHTTAGIGVLSSQTRELTKQDMWMSGPNGSVTYNVPDIGREFSHEADGTIKDEKNVWGKVYANVPSSPNLPPNRWYYADVRSQIEDIDRRKPNLSLAIHDDGIVSATVKMTVDYYCHLCAWRIKGTSNWNYFDAPSGLAQSGGGSANYTVSGLKPNTSYELEFRVRRKYNEVWSNSQFIKVQTSKPNTPSAGTFIVDNITETSATLTMSNFSFAEHSTWGYYEYNLNNTGWRKGEANNQFTIKGLKEDTLYTIQVRLVNNYEGRSEAITETFKTKSGQATALYNVNGVWKSSRIWDNELLQWKKINKSFVNVNGIWKQTK